MTGAKEIKRGGAFAKNPAIFIFIEAAFADACGETAVCILPVDHTLSFVLLFKGRVANAGNRNQSRVADNAVCR